MRQRLNTMASFRQIGENEWQVGDYRPKVLINRKAAELFQNYQVSFKEYSEDGLGKAKSAFFLTSNNTQFSVRELIEPKTPITEIFILNNPNTIENELNEILEILRLSYSDLDFVYKY